MDIITFIYASPEIRWGKSLQVYVDKHPYLIISHYSFRHDEILARFLTDNSIPFTTELLHKGDVGPKFRGERYELIGAGCATLKDEIVLNDHSESYRMHPCEKHAAELTALLGNRIIRVEKPRPVETPSPPLVKRVCSSEDDCPF